MAKSTNGETSSVPLYGLDTCIEIIQVLQENGGRLAKEALAEQLGTTSSSSRFVSKLASGRYFGLLMYDQDLVHISEIGKQIVSPLAAKESSHAICNAFGSISAYNELVRRYGITKIPSKDLVANFFDREYGMSPSGKRKAASAYLKSLELYLDHSSDSEEQEEAVDIESDTESRVPIVYKSSPQANCAKYFRLGRIIGQLQEIMKSDRPFQGVLGDLFETLLEIPQLKSIEPTIKQHAELASEIGRSDILLPDFKLIQRLIEGDADE